MEQKNFGKIRINSKNKIARILIIIGIIPLTIGFYFLVNSLNENNYNFSELLSDIPKERILEFNSPYYKLDQNSNKTFVYYDKFDLENETYVKFKLLFKTNDVFSVANPIEYKIKTKIIGKPIVDDVVFFIETRGVDYSVIDDENIDNIIERFKGQSTIDLEKKSDGAYKEDMILEENSTAYFPFGLTYYENEDFFTVPSEGNISLHPFIIGKERIYKLDTAEELFTVNPAYTKLQAETNRIIIKNAQIQARSNDITLGLSLVVLAGIPISIGSQILISNKQFQMKYPDVNNIEQKISVIEKDVKDIHSRTTGLYKKSD